MRKTAAKPTTKDLILKAAERVVSKRGPSHLTLDAVAREAGFSKGGLLYNFPTKQALVEGMIGSYVERRRSHLEQLRTEAGDRPNTVIQSILAVRKEYPVDRGTGLAILAGLAENPEFLAPLREEVAVMAEDMQKNAEDPMLATLLWLAADGLEFWDLLGINPLNAKGRTQMENYFVSLAAAEGGTPA